MAQHINHVDECLTWPLCKRAFDGDDGRVFFGCDGCPCFRPRPDNKEETAREIAHGLIDTIFKHPAADEGYALLLYVDGGEPMMKLLKKEEKNGNTRTDQ